MSQSVAWSEWIELRRKDLTDDSHGNELTFVEAVLSQVSGLAPSSVSSQVAFKDVQSGNRRIDFVINDSRMARPIAIEVDGRNKTGKQQTQREFDDWDSRQNALAAEGYTLIRYTNNQVRHSAKQVIAEIQNAIAKERTGLLSMKQLSADTAQDVASQVAARVGEAVALKITSRLLIMALIAVTMVVVLLVVTRDPSTKGPDSSGVPPVSEDSCPAKYPLKGNLSSKIYHSPGQKFYDQTDPERCFATPEDAERWGYRAALM